MELERLLLFNFGASDMMQCNRPGRQLGVDASVRPEPVVIGNNSWGLLLRWGSITRAIRASWKGWGAAALLSSYMDRQTEAGGQAFDVSLNGISYHEQATSAVRDRVAVVPYLWLISAAARSLGSQFWDRSFGEVLLICSSCVCLPLLLFTYLNSYRCSSAFTQQPISWELNSLYYTTT
jgi:hypothetical protein